MAAGSFEAALAEVLRHEGGYADHPSDPGGATMMGITIGTLEKWRGRPVSKAELRAISRQEAGAIYRARYWLAVRADELPAGLDLAMFDFAVNSGPSRAIRTLQGVLGVRVDGRLGPASRSAVNGSDPAMLISRLCQARLAFLERLPAFAVFGRGWRRRVGAVEAAALRLQRQTIPEATRTSIPQERTTMDISKPFFMSKTVWSNVIGLAAIILSVFGVDTGGIDQAALVESLLQGIAALSFVFSTVFRVIASQKIS